MHSVLLHAVSLWDIAESRVWGADIIPRKHWSDPLVLMNVNRRWSQLITSSPLLWSHVLIDTDDDDVLDYLQLFLLLSRNKRLFIVLHGSGSVYDDILVQLLQVGSRIDTLVYPPNVSRSTLARFRFYFGTSHEDIWRWSGLEVQSGTQPQRCLHYTFPISMQSLWMSGLFPLSRLVTLSDFQSLSSLSVRISLDRALPPADKAGEYRLELPKLEVLRAQITLGSHDQVDTPINMICRNLKLLELRYTLELDIKNPHKQPVTWMEFGEVDGVEELQIDLAIREVTEVGSIQSSTQRPPRLERLEQLKQQRELKGREQLKGWEQRLERWLERREQQLKDREQQLFQQRLEGQRLGWLMEGWLMEEWLMEQPRAEQQRVEQLEQLEEQQDVAQQQVEQWLEQQRLEQQLELEQLEQLEEEQLEELEQQQVEQQQVEQWLEQQRLEQQLELEELGQLEEELEEGLRELQELRKQQVQYLRFTKSICTHWREWLNLPNSLTHVQQSSLKLTAFHEYIREHAEL